METDGNYPVQFKNVIEKIIDADLNKRGITKYISALVKGINDNGTVNVCIPPNLDSIISGLLNKTGETLSEGDSVELCAKNGSVNNSWVAIKHKTNNSGGGVLDYDDLINKPIIRIANNNELSPTIIYDLNEGIYSLSGYIKFFVQDADTTLFETPTIMIITSSGEEKYAQIFYPNGNRIVSYRIDGAGYSGTDRGLPSGGTVNQVLVKKSNTDYDAEWSDITGQVLYDNSTGTNETVTLSDSSTNYDYIDIFYRDNDNTCSSVRVNNPNGKSADISTIERWGTTLYIKQKRITISGNTITNGNATEANFTTAPKIGINTTANNIYITKVIGYKDTPRQVDVIPMSDMYYKSGDVYTIADRTYITVGGSLTAAKSQIRFGVFLPKLLTNINSVTVSLAKLTIRNTAGSYILDYEDVTSALSAAKSGDNTVYLSYGASDIAGTNNTPVSVEINALKLIFN